MNARTAAVLNGARTMLTDLRVDVGPEIFSAVVATGDSSAFHNFVDANEWLWDAAANAYPGDPTEADGCMTEDFMEFSNEVHDALTTLLTSPDPEAIVVEVLAERNEEVDLSRPRLSWLRARNV